jgi:hypothetical protein
MPRIHPSTRLWPYGVQVRTSWVIGGLLLVTLAACSQTSNAPPGGVPAPTTATPKAKATPTPTPRPTPKAPARAALPTDCTLLLTHASINRTLGRTLTGRTIYIKGVPESRIGRTGRTTCRYGVSGKTVPIEVSVSGYRTVAEATTRVRVSVAAEVDAGAHATKTTIAHGPATITIGRHGSLVIYGTVNRTVAVTIAPGVGGTRTPTVLKQLAEVVVANLP